MTRSHRTVLAAPLALALFANTASAGPPLLCFPFETGGAPSLPWREGGWKGLDPAYDRSRLVADASALLGPEAPTIARMETLRRAALYASDARSGPALLKALDARAAKAAPGAEHALALFDLGFGMAVLSQAGAIGSGGHQAPPTAYRKIQDAIRERGGDPAMEYAAALVNHDGVHREEAFEHLRAAVGGAPAGSPLARTLTAHRDLWGDALERARAAVARR